VVHVIYKVDRDRGNNKELKTLLEKLQRYKIKVDRSDSESESPSGAISYKKYQANIIKRCFYSRYGWALLHLDQLEDTTALDMIYEWLKDKLNYAKRLEKSKHFLINKKIQ
jgi:hypothetical protein